MTIKQKRGNCQLCARDHAVLHQSGKMAKHGYDLQHGYMRGRCHGEDHPPMQVARNVTDNAVAQMRQLADEREQQAAKVREGKLKPPTITRGYGKQEREIPFAEADEYEQNQAVRRLAVQLESSARGLRLDAGILESVASQVHGKALRLVDKPKPATPIVKGERRLAKSGMVMVAVRVDGPRVYFRWADKEPGGLGHSGWLGTRAWRDRELI